jgi:hypothetical protein
VTATPCQWRLDTLESRSNTPTVAIAVVNVQKTVGVAESFQALLSNRSVVR